MDTVPVPSDEETAFFLTSVHSNDCLVKCRRGDDRWETVFDKNSSVRCAGKIIQTDVGLVRPSQNDEGRYGNSLHFHLIDDCSYEGYREHEFLHVLPPDSERKENEICVGLHGPSKIRFGGVHTYNCNESYEIIDMAYYGECNRVIFWKKRKKFVKYLQKKL